MDSGVNDESAARVLIFTINTYGSVLQSKHGVKHLSVTVMEPVQLHLMAPPEEEELSSPNCPAAFVFVGFFDCHLQTMSCETFMMSPVCRRTHKDLPKQNKSHRVPDVGTVFLLCRSLLSPVCLFVCFSKG